MAKKPLLLRFVLTGSRLAAVVLAGCTTLLISTILVSNEFDYLSLQAKLFGGDGQRNSFERTPIVRGVESPPEFLNIVSLKQKSLIALCYLSPVALLGTIFYRVPLIPRISFACSFALVLSFYQALFSPSVFLQPLRLTSMEEAKNEVVLRSLTRHMPQELVPSLTFVSALLAGLLPTSRLPVLHLLLATSLGIICWGYWRQPDSVKRNSVFQPLLSSWRNSTWSAILVGWPSLTYNHSRDVLRFNIDWLSVQDVEAEVMHNFVREIKPVSRDTASSLLQQLIEHGDPSASSSFSSSSSGLSSFMLRNTNEYDANYIQGDLKGWMASDSFGARYSRQWRASNDGTQITSAVLLAPEVMLSGFPPSAAEVDGSDVHIALPVTSPEFGSGWLHVIGTSSQQTEPANTARIAALSTATKQSAIFNPSFREFALGQPLFTKDPEAPLGSYRAFFPNGFDYINPATLDQIVTKPVTFRSGTSSRSFKVKRVAFQPAHPLSPAAVSPAGDRPLKPMRYERLGPIAVAAPVSRSTLPAGWREFTFPDSGDFSITINP